VTGKHWEHFSHDADIGVRGFGNIKSEAFEQAALALTGVMLDPRSLDTHKSVTVHCEAPDDELLLFDWLNAIVYEMATKNMLFARYQVKLTDHVLDGTAWGEPVDVERHQPAVEVKGATLTALGVAQQSDGAWMAQCVVDV
jgi:tRNA nucleotidyltransferase (CCA-adding enzyme)